MRQLAEHLPSLESAVLVDSTCSAATGKTLLQGAAGLAQRGRRLPLRLWKSGFLCVAKGFALGPRHHPKNPPPRNRGLFERNFLERERELPHLEIGLFGEPRSHNVMGARWTEATERRSTSMAGSGLEGAGMGGFKRFQNNRGLQMGVHPRSNRGRVRNCKETERFVDGR